jgi:hypothetical protein
MGNVRAACEAALVCHTYLYRYRKADPEFAAAWDAALSQAGERLAAGREGGRPPEGQLYWRGGMMQVIGGHGAVPPRLIAQSPRRWTGAKEKRFLRTLSVTANVTLAAEEAGVSARACYWQRTRRPGFARRWDAALEEGVMTVEMQLIRDATRIVEDDDIFDEEPRPIMSYTDAILLVAQHKRRMARDVRLGGHPRREVDIEDVRASVLRKVRAFQALGDGTGAPTG